MALRHSSVLIRVSIFLILLFAGVLFVIATGDSIQLKGFFGNPHNTGSFDPAGNAWEISFDKEPAIIPAEWFSWVQIVHLGTDCVNTPKSDLVLTGTFWVETVGWATFSDVWSGPVCIIPPIDGKNIRSDWTLSGYAWSENAGWIKLNPGETFASGVIYLPDTNSFTGFAWSDTLGWISFAASSESKKWFIWQVKVIGNIGGSKVFDVLSTTPGKAYDSVALTSLINQVKKNVALQMRNAGNKINTTLIDQSNANTFVDSMVFNIVENASDVFVKYSTLKTRFNNDSDRSLITIGADIVIDVDFTWGADKSRSIIALKNEKWQWWDIYISGDVKKINASIVAEGTIYSGKDFLSTQLTTYYTNKSSAFLDLPHNQLWIVGSVLGHNTIGWGSKDDQPVCPYNGININCTYDTAIPYDWNYFRAYTGTDAGRAYKNNSFDSYSTIIDYDPRILSDPPPGLSGLR